MHSVAMKIADNLKARVEAIGIDNIKGETLAELGMWTDVMKDLADYDKNMRIIEAMDREEAEGMDDNMRMGYRGRDSKGRFVHMPGRGRSAGYTMYNDHMAPPMGYTMPTTMGYTMPTAPMGYTGYNANGVSKYGRAYDGYKTARMGYTQTQDPEEHRKMRESINDIFNDMEEVVTDVWKDVTPEDRAKYKQKLQQMMAKMA